MAILINNKGDISLEIKLVNNDFLDLNSDYGGWIPYHFSFKLLNKEYHFPENSDLTFTLDGLNDLILNVKRIVSLAKKYTVSKPFHYYTFESSFNIKFEDPNEYDSELNRLTINPKYTFKNFIDDIEVELWINMGALTNGAVSSYDKGFRFSVKLESLSKFITQFENELTLLINL